MKRLLFISCLCYWSIGIAIAQEPSKVHRVYVLGNTADIPDEELIRYTDAMYQMFSKISDPFTLIYAGDLSRQKNMITTPNSMILSESDCW